MGYCIRSFKNNAIHAAHDAWIARFIALVFIALLIGFRPAPAAADPIPKFGPAVPLTALNTSNPDEGASLAGDGLTLYFSQRLLGSVQDWNILRASRPTRDDPFGAPMAVLELNVPIHFDAHPWISFDQLPAIPGALPGLGGMT